MNMNCQVHASLHVVITAPAAGRDAAAPCDADDDDGQYVNGGVPCEGAACGDDWADTMVLTNYAEGDDN